MKILILTLLVATAAFAEEVDQLLDHKKRGVQKNSPHNAIPNNAAHKQEFSNYQQPTSQHKQPGPVTSQTYQQREPVQPPAHQQQYNIIPYPQQVVPLHLIPQPVLAPKFQLIASKNPQGLMQLTLVPHNVLLNLAYTPNVMHPVMTNQQSNTAQVSPTVASSYTSSNYNNYVTPQTASFAHPQPTSTVPLTQPNYYTHQQPQFSYYKTVAPSQHSSQIVYSQPGPVAYNQYSPPQSNYLYTPEVNQALNYYRSNPQAKYQLLYGNSQEQPSAYQQEQSNAYQTSLPGIEYEKPTQLQSSQYANQKTDHVSNNEFLSPADTHFRPMSPYRVSAYYKH